jgi:hypothetical protein
MQPCPRQTNEATMSVQLAHQSHWREDGTCSYCGSLSPDQFFEAIAKGAEFGPTDKNYKVYVARPDPDAGKPWIYSVAPHKPDGDGWIEVTADNIESLPKADWRDLLGKWVRVSPKSATRRDKFYFQHLNEDERKRFIELLNAKALKIGDPGYFYRLPFFAQKLPA